MLLDIDKFCKETIIDGNYLPEITSSSTRLSNGTYDSKGLFSIDIFGQERSTRWKTMYAKITIPHPVIHPAIFYIINRRVSYLLKWINLDFGFVIDKDTNHFVLTNTVNNYDYCGITDLYSNANIVVDALSKTGKFDTLSAKTIMARLIDRKLPIFTSNVIVMPPIFRPNDEDNTFYIKIIEEINILRSALSSKDKILTNRILANIQNIYNYLFELMVDKIKGKTGLIRGSMLGKNADFSGRAVIVVDPDIKPSQLGVPRTMLIRLFYPWIINYIIHNDRVKKELNDLKVATNIPSLFNLINNDLFEKSVDNRIYKILNMVMEIVIKDKVILSKRDPVLHKLSVRGFYPVPVDDTSIHITPLVTTGFNADFDGDQMSVFVPLTDKAQKIVKEKMLATKNLWHPVKGLSYTIEKDFVLGIYTMTKDDAPTDSKVTTLSNSDNIVQRLIESDHMYNLVNYKGRTNTIGRRVVEILFNDTIQVKEAVDEKKLSSYLEKVAKEDPDSLEDVMYRVIQVSKVISSIFGGTMSVKDFIMPKDLIDKKNEVLKNPDKYDVDSELTNITKEFMARNTSASTNQLPTLLVNSGARGSAGNIKQISVAKGYVSDTSGKVLPDAIGSNFVEGFKPIDYFISAYGSRKGVVDRVLNTAKSGYLQRQMMYLVASVKSSDTKDCGTNKFLDVVLTEEYANVLANRVLDNGAILTSNYIKQHDLIGKMIHVYTPMYCRSRGLCRKCFPEAYRKAIDNVINVGMVSGNIVGERASQLVMRVFHCLQAQNCVIIKKGNDFFINTIETLYRDREDLAIKTLSNTQDEIDVSNEDLYVEDANGSFTKVLKIIRHRRNPNSPIVMIRTRGGNPLVLQDNHPIAIRKANDVIDFIEPKDFDLTNYSEAVTSNMNFWQSDHRECPVDPYLLGTYLGDGAVRITYSNNNYRHDMKPRSVIIAAPSTKLNGKLHSKLKDIVLHTRDKIARNYRDRELRIYDTDLGIKILELCNRYSYSKHLPPEMFYYDDDTLAAILCGVIDTDGTIHKRSGYINSITITMSNIGVIYSLKLICDKLGMKCNVLCHKPSENANIKFSHQPYELHIYPSVKESKWLKESIRCERLTYPEKRQNRKFANQTDDTYMYYKPTIFDDELDESYVYDLMTESHTFMANGLLVHNTGGAASMLYLSKEAPQLDGIIGQDGMQLIANKDIRIKVIDYTNDSTEEFASVDFDVITKDDGNEVSVHFPAVVKFNSLIARNMKIEDTDVYLEYDSGEIIGEILATATDVASAVLVLQSIMNHADQFESGKDIVTELYETFRIATKIPLIYLEIIVSQLMRDPKKIYYPYRLGSMTEAPKFVGIKSVASLESPTRGIMFERLLDTITNSVLIGDTKDERLKSDLEELFAI